MTNRIAFKKIDLFIPLEGDSEISVNVSGGNKFLHSLPNRIPSPSEIGELEIALLKTGAEIVNGDGREFIRTKEIVGRYDNGMPYKHLQYKVR